MFQLKEQLLIEEKKRIGQLPARKLLVNTINAHSYNTALKDEAFAEALMRGDALIPDGASIVWACRIIKGCKSKPKERIAGWDLFEYEMERMNLRNVERGVDRYGKRPTVMFLGSTEKVLGMIREKAKVVYPNVDVVTFSPPYKEVFSEEDNQAMIRAVNEAKPDLLWIGMTAPKQEKWAYEHWAELDINCHVGTIGAVFDFFAGTARRAPEWWQRHSLEWLYRLIREPKRMWRRYLIGNVLFVWNILTHEIL